MNASENQAIVTLALLAAFADNDKHERERAEIKRIAEGLSQADGIHLPSLYQNVLMKRVGLPEVVAALPDRDARQLAYEMAVCVCDADGTLSEPERRFLDGARDALGLDAGDADRFSAQAGELAAVTPSSGQAPIDAAGATAAIAAAGAATTAASASVPGGRVAAATSNVDAAELDQAILNAAILNGALELLPETLSTMAIIPLQMKLVYRIGKAHGYELDTGHIKDFIATVGVGLTSQYLEQAGRKLLGGLLGKVGGGLLRGVGNQAVSSGMSFATTYALGHVAKRYYAGGRTLSTQMLKDAYAGVVKEGQGLQTRYLPAIQEKARTINPSQILSMVRGA
ncbi:YcjF family protein [Variovorax sp. PvP013]|uniref:YcjF family protein n=1 Tax=Variovorax sp. PvP013 TaxID=3156435 RepID=UPI003D20258A